MRQSTKPVLDIIVPVYNEEEIIKQSAAVFVGFLESLIQRQLVDEKSQIVLVNDGSRDATWHMIEELTEAHESIKGIKLSRNFGHQQALMAGMSNSDADCVVTIDADLQDDITCIEKMLEAYRHGYEVVFGVRNDRSSDSFGKRFTAEMFYKIMLKMGVPLVFNHADYRLLGRQALNTLLDFGEVNLFLRGIVANLGFKSTEVHYARAARTAGETKYPLRKMIEFAVQGITSFSIVPLRFIFFAGTIAFLVSIALTIWVFVIKYLTGEAIPGWSSTVLPIYFLGGAQLLALGVVGEFVGKIYLETKRRPRFIVERLCAKKTHR